MGEFFKGRRRTIGVMTLGLACLFMGGWARTVMCLDTFIYCNDNGSSVIEVHSESGIVHFSFPMGYFDLSECHFLCHYVDDLAYPIFIADVDLLDEWHLEMIPEGVSAVPVGWKWLGLEFYRDDSRANGEFGYIFQCWSIVIPLTLISLLLLLSKPRKSSPHKITEPVPERVA